MAGMIEPDVRPKDKGSSLPFTKDTGVDLSTCIPEIAENTETDCIRGYFHCPNHQGLIPYEKLDKKHLPEGCRTEENLRKMKEHARRTVRVKVKKRSPDRPERERGGVCAGEVVGEKLVWGTGFLFPGGFYEDRPCVCKDCVKSGNPRMGYHVAYVLTAKHVVFDEHEANNVKFDLFYEDRYKRNLRRIGGVGMAGDEECVVRDGEEFVVMVDGGVSGKDGSVDVGGGGSGKDGSVDVVGYGRCKDGSVDVGGGGSGRNGGDDDSGGGNGGDDDSGSGKDGGDDDSGSGKDGGDDDSGRCKDGRVDVGGGGSGKNGGDDDSGGGDGDSCSGTISNAYKRLDVDIAAIENWGSRVRSEMKTLMDDIKSFLVDYNKAEIQDENILHSSLHLGWSLRAFTDLLPKGYFQLALNLCRARLHDLLDADDIRKVIHDNITDKARDIMKGFYNSYDELMHRLKIIQDQCLKLSALCKYFVRDMNMHECVRRLYYIVGEFHSWSFNLMLCHIHLRTAKFDYFINLCNDMCQYLHNADDSLVMNSQHQTRESNGGDHNTETSSPASIKLCVLEDEAQCKMFSSTINRFSDALFTAGKNDSYLFLVVLIPLFMDHTDGGSFDFFQTAFQRFWDLFSINNFDFEIISSSSCHIVTVLSAALDELYQKCPIEETDPEFLAALHSEMVDSNRGTHRLEITRAAAQIVQYKTDQVLVKCATHDPEMIKKFKDMTFLPPKVPFMFIVSHPHAYYKHFGVGSLVRDSSPVNKRPNGLFVVKMGAKSKFKLLKSCHLFPSNMEKFLNLIKFGNENGIAISANEEYPLNVELSLAFPEESMDDFRIVGQSCWLKFPSGTVCIYGDQNTKSFVLPENLEFYSYYNPEDVMRSMEAVTSECFIHDVPTCECSSGSLVYSPSPFQFWFTHCASFIHDAKKYGLTSICYSLLSNFSRARGKDLPSIKEFLNIQTNVFSVPTDKIHHSVSPFLDEGGQ